MIPILYGAKENKFEHNGIGLLTDTIKCLAIEEQNGTYELELTYRVGSFLCQLLTEDNIIKAKANEEHEHQLFRIYYVSEELDGTIQVKAEHISYDLRGNFLEGIFLANVTCQEAGNEALKRLEESHNFTFYSDIDHTANYNLARCNGLEAIAGKRGSLLDTFGNGTKLIRDNFRISLVKERGTNNNVLISYRKNMTGYKRELDLTDLVTKIYPFAIMQHETNTENRESVEEMIVLPERFLVSKNYNKYAKGKIVSLDYSSEESVRDISSLRKISEKWFRDTKRDEPNINYQVEFINLYKTSNYKNLGLEQLERVCIDDTVIVRDYRFGLDVDARVMKTIYNSLSERYEKIELGKFKDSLKFNDPDLNDKVDDAINKIKNMYVRFEVLDDKIISEVSRLDGDIKTHTTLIQQTADAITQVAKRIDGAESSIVQNADSITQIVKDIKGNTSLIQQNASAITQKVSNGTFESYKTQTADQIASKVGSDNLGSLLEQNPNSIKIGFNQISDSAEIDSTGMQFKDSAGNKSIALYRGNLYLYEPNTNVFMGAGVISRWNSGQYNAGTGVLASDNSYYYSIAKSNGWTSDSQLQPPSPSEYLIINYRDRGSALTQKVGTHIYYGLYAHDGINLMAKDIANANRISTLYMKCSDYTGSDGTPLFSNVGSTMNNKANWDWANKNLLNAKIQYATLSNCTFSGSLSVSSLSSSGTVSSGTIQTSTYKGGSGSTIFATPYGTGDNKTGWAWNNNNLLDPRIIGGSYGYSLSPILRNYVDADLNLDGILDSINIYPSQSKYKNKSERSLEIDVTDLKNNENADLFIKEHEIINSETGESEVVENIDMKSMLHLALLEIKNLKEEVRVLKEKVGA